MSVLLLPSPTTRLPAPAAIRSPRSETNDETESDLFSREELRQFADDDRQAGRRIGTILCALFIYPLIVMTGVIWWTFRTVVH